jgi:hypothetical protein
VCHPHDFVRCLRAAHEGWFNQLRILFGVPCGFPFELPELGKLIEKIVIDAWRVRGNHLLAAFSDPKMPSSRAFQ